MRAAGLMLFVAASAAGAPLPDAGAFCELTPCLPGLAHRRLLTRTEVIQHIACRRGDEVGTDDAGALMYCTTARAETIDGLPVAAGAYSLFFPSGHVYQTTLARARDFTLADGSTVGCAAGFVAVTETGALFYCMLGRARDHARVGDGIGFYPDGHLASATLAQRTTFAGLAVPAGSRVAWDRAGGPAAVTLEAPVTIGSLQVNYELTFHPGGKLHEATIVEPTTIHGRTYPAFAKLAFRADGSLEAAEWKAAQGFMIHGEPWSDTQTETYDAAGAVLTTKTVHFQGESPEQFRREHPNL